MVMTRYAKGRAFEYRTMAILKEKGWMVSRSAASHGAVDVFAAKDGQLLLVQVKSGTARVKKEELEELVLWAKHANAEAQVWHFRGRGKVEKRRVFAANGRQAR